MSAKHSIGILGTGFFVPETIIDNDYFVQQGLDTSDDWIQSRTGIKQRRIDQSITTSQLASLAAEQALQNSSYTSSDIGMIIVATSTADQSAFPSTACLVQKQLHIKQAIPAFDVSAACTGFNYALTLAELFINQNKSQIALVIGAECLHKIVDWQDRSTCILFGDGAGAVLLGHVKKETGLLYSRVYSDSDYTHILTGDINQKIFMDGPALFKLAITKIVPAIQDALAVINKKISDLDYLIPHQANQRIINSMIDKLGMAPQRVIMNLDRFGNTSAASIPIALSEAHQAGTFKEGQLIALVGFGAGFTWGIHLLYWHQS